MCIYMVNQSDIAVCNILFEPAPKLYRGQDPEKLNIAIERAGRILSRYYWQDLGLGAYRSSEQVEKCFNEMSLKPFKSTNKYPLRLKPEYGHLWKP